MKIIKKIRSSWKILLLIIFISGAVGFLVYYLKPTSIKLPFPYTAEPLSEYQFSCEALAGSFLRGSNNVFEKGIFAEVFKGTDKIAIEIEDNKLYFITKAAVEVGYAKGYSWEIIKNTNDRIIAIYNGLDDLGTDFNLFILNKKNGIAVWSKTNSDLFGTENPSAQSYYLLCR